TEDPADVQERPGVPGNENRDLPWRQERGDDEGDAGDRGGPQEPAHRRNPRTFLDRLPAHARSVAHRSSWRATLSADRASYRLRSIARLEVSSGCRKITPRC